MGCPRHVGCDGEVKTSSTWHASADPSPEGTRHPTASPFGRPPVNVRP
jgi:hypothetical protein